MNELDALHPLWVFGYGSLVWRPSIPFDESQPARIRGFDRRFYQGSTDHRGVPRFPGRVVTLVPAEGQTVWGRAFRIPDPRRDDVLANLDHREKGGYDRLIIDIEMKGRMVRGLVYWATPRNPHYAGPESVEEIAQVVRAAHGPSGPNDEYVLRLAEALRGMGADDPHVFAVERAVLGG